MVTVRQSSVTIDLIAFPDCDGNIGLGVYQNRTGACLFRVVGPNVESIDKSAIHRLQKPYAIQSAYDEDKVIVPTVDSIRLGNIPVPFRVQHSSDSATHKLDYHEHALDYPFSYPVLVPNGIIVAGTEISFDYNL